MLKCDSSIREYKDFVLNTDCFFFFKGTVRFDKANELQGEIGCGCFIRTAKHCS